MSEDEDKKHWVTIDGESHHLTESDAQLLYKQRAELQPAHLLYRIQCLENSFERLLQRLETAAARD